LVTLRVQLAVTVTVTLETTLGVPALEQVRVKVWVPGVRPLMVCDPPATDLEPDQSGSPEATQLVGPLVVFQFRVTKLAGSVIVKGLAVRVTVGVATGALLTTKVKVAVTGE
jgi:hypothetical protein